MDLKQSWDFFSNQRWTVPKYCDMHPLITDKWKAVNGIPNKNGHTVSNLSWVDSEIGFHSTINLAHYPNKSCEWEKDQVNSFKSLLQFRKNYIWALCTWSRKRYPGLPTMQYSSLWFFVCVLRLFNIYHYFARIPNGYGTNNRSIYHRRFCITEQRNRK